MLKIVAACLLALLFVMPLAAQNAGVEKIAFVTADQEAETMTLMVADPDGSDAQPFVVSEKIYNPVWSPDGRHIAFSAALPNYSRSDVYVIGSDGTNARKVSVRPSQYPSAIAWSADSTEVFYTLPGGGGRQDEIHRVQIDDAETDVKLPLDFSSTIMYDLWVAASPDGEQVAFVAYNDALFGSKPGLFVASVDGSNVEPFAATLPDGTRFQHLNWSPDGEQVLLTYINGGAAGYDTLSVANADGTNVREIQGAARNIWGGAWSPDGSQILFGANKADGDMTPDLDLWVVNADGTNLHALNVGVYVTYQSQAWGLLPADVVLPTELIVLKDALG